MRKIKKRVLLEKILVSDYAAEGKSIARCDGKVIFMENAIPGDLVDVQLTKNKKDWAEGYITAFRQYSEDRIPAFCAHFGVCGGCQWQMLPYEKQLSYKQKQVEETLKRIGKIALPETLPIIGAAASTRYRNKIEYSFSNRRFLLADELADPSISVNQPAAGFHARGLFDKVVDIETCHLQMEPSNQLRLAVKKWGIENKVSFYDTKAKEGFLRGMQVRICDTGEVMVNMIFGFADKEKINSLLDHLLEYFPGISTLLYTINTKMNDSLHGLYPQTYSGKGYIKERLEDFQFIIGPKSFFQTNSKQAERLYRVAREFAGLNGREILYDLYCGTGSIGIFLSREAKKIIGVDLVPEAIEDAKKNAILNNITHAEFIAGDVTEICDHAFFLQHGNPDLLITDPPRAGMHEKLVRRILDINAPKIVYISCNPATQARDLNMLDEKYRVEKMQPVDMFPHTHHIENVVLLVTKD